MSEAKRAFSGESDETNGLLPHEIAFLTHGIKAAIAIKKAADMEYGAAVANSGGDWAFDDMASAAAAFDAHLADQNLARRTQFSALRLLEYPSPDSDAVAIGSRIVLETPRWTATYDVVSRKIPDMPEDADNDVELLSAQTALGASLLGKRPGEGVVWEAPSGELVGTVVSVDQIAQRTFYASLIDIQA